MLFRSKRTENSLDSRQVLSVIEKYSEAFEITYELSYEECREVIAGMRLGDESELFGKEKDDSFKGN